MDNVYDIHNFIIWHYNPFFIKCYKLVHCLFSIYIFMQIRTPLRFFSKVAMFIYLLEWLLAEPRWPTCSAPYVVWRSFLLTDCKLQGLVNVIWKLDNATQNCFAPVGGQVCPRRAPYRVEFLPLLLRSHQQKFNFCWWGNNIAAMHEWYLHSHIIFLVEKLIARDFQYIWFIFSHWFAHSKNQGKSGSGFRVSANETLWSRAVSNVNHNKQCAEDKLKESF